MPIAKSEGDMQILHIASTREKANENAEGQGITGGKAATSLSVRQEDGGRQEMRKAVQNAQTSSFPRWAAKNVRDCVSQGCENHGIEQSSP